MGAFFAGRSQRGDASPTTELFRVYVQYKKDTKAIISWLLSHRPAKSSIPLPERLSVRDLMAVADQICASAAVALPDAIAFQFRQAITARTHLTKVFRKVSTGSRDSACTENHEYFTSRSIACSPCIIASTQRLLMVPTAWPRYIKTFAGTAPNQKIHAITRVGRRNTVAKVEFAQIVSNLYVLIAARSNTRVTQIYHQTARSLPKPMSR